MKTEIKCPQCKKQVVWQNNPDRPFCSERCRLIDLGRWADESYRIAGKQQGVLADENVVQLSHEEQDPERS